MNGFGNAHSVSRALSVLANGGAVDSVRLLSPRTIARVFELQSQGIDRVLGIPLAWGIGYALPAPPLDALVPAGSQVFFWGGYGGSMSFVDVGRRMTISFVMNKLQQDIIGGPRVAALVACAYACLAAA
jgi:CubicO group peptidase (beta-lactamase class C family)